MKAISLTEPWATLVAIGAKRIETRSRNFVGSFRGPLAIHASGAFPKWAKEMCGEEPFFSALIHNELSPGCIVATCNLVDVLPMEARGCLPGVFEQYPDLDTPQEQGFGDFSFGRWALVLEDIKRLDKPVPAKGALGLWEWEG